jgi:hypothetical protein
VADEVDEGAFVETNELTRAIRVQVLNFKSELTLLAEVVNNLKVVRIVGVKIIVNYFRVVNFEPIGLVGVPLHLEQNLGV